MKNPQRSLTKTAGAPEREGVVDAGNPLPLRAIVLACLGCGRTMDYERGIDPTIPPNVVKIESEHCDECDRGGTGTEYWLDASGREISQDDRQY